MNEGSGKGEVTRLLSDWSSGDQASLDRLLPIIYEELKQLARAHMRRERSGHTLQTTAVVHEAYLKMVELEKVDWEARSHFFAAASNMMRRLLIDHARRHRAQKRGGGAGDLPLDENIVMSAPEAEDLLALHEALLELEGIDRRQAQLVELRHFGGLTVEEAAQTLNVSPSTVKREWRIARLWLHDRLSS